MVEINLNKEFATLINQYKNTQFKATQKAMEKTGDEIVKIMTNATPISNGTGLFKRSWKKKVYKDAVYIYNNRGVGGLDKGILVSNLYEHGRKFTPFIQKTFKANENKFFKIFKETLQKEIK